MELKKIVIRLMLFLACTMACYTLCMYLLLKLKNKSEPLIYSVSDAVVHKGGNTFRKFNDFDEKKMHDILVIGSSHAYRGYDPRIFKEKGMELFNLGTSAQTPLNTYFLATHYIKRENCKLVIIDIYDEALTSDGMESAADLMQNINSTKVVFKMGLALKDPRVLNMLAMRFFYAKRQEEYTDHSYVLNGYSQMNDSLKQAAKVEYKLDKEVNPVQLKYLEKTLAYLTNHEVNVIMVTHPAPMEWNAHQHTEISGLIKKIAGEFGVKYLDYFSSPGFKTHIDFYDSHHLNQNGVEKFNTMLIRDLSRSGALPL